jgi:acetyltransferase
VICWLLDAREPSRRFQTAAQALGIPVLREIPRAVECLKTIFTQRAVSIPPPADTPLPASLAERLGSARGALDEHRSKKILADCGIPVVAERLVATPAAAAAAAQEWGYPVVLKGLLPGAVHKTEQGLVRLGIASAAALEAAFHELAAAMGVKGEILLQQMVHGGPELIAGALRDPQFGPCVMCGLGGTLAEILGDAAFAVAPLSREDALALVGRLKTRQLLDGFRGAPPVDREALADTLVRLGRLMAAFPDIREIDINPLICVDGRPLAVDASIIVSE